MRLFLVGLILITLSSCSTVRPNKFRVIDDEKLIGTWRLFGGIGSDGVKTYRSKIPDSIFKTITFKSNGKISGNYFKHARYTVVASSKQYIPNGVLAIIFNGSTAVVYNYHFEGDHLHLQRYPDYCDEGCTIIFSKVESSPGL